MTQPVHAGLFHRSAEPCGPSAQVPLQGVQIHAELVGLCSRVTVRQRFRNTEKRDIEAVYVFPLEEGAAVCNFEARIGARVIKGEVEERERAFEIYDDAMAEGHGAFLLDQERPNVFTLSVGNLKPAAELEITISYVAQTNYEGEAIRLMLPTTVSPRYAPGHTPAEVGQPDAERVNPPTQDSVPYGLCLAVDVLLDTAIKGIESPSHNVRLELDGQAARVTLSHDSVELDRDFVLLVKPGSHAAATGRLAREQDGTRVAMVTFRAPKERTGQTAREVHFVLDCSGSMGGDSIAQATRALELCLRALQSGDSFNIVLFGSSHRLMWPAARPYTEASLQEATQLLSAVDASMGGTEIFRPMHDVLGAAASGSGLRDVLLLTDGQVSNEDEIIALVASHRVRARVFAFGIGAGASEYLVRGVARASGGAAEFIFPGERIEQKVLRMFGRLRSPVFGDVSIDWGNTQAQQAPAQCPPVFAGEALTVFARLPGELGESAVLSAAGHRFEVALQEAPGHLGDHHVGIHGLVPTLWARHRIRDLEEGKGRRMGSNQRRAGEQQERAETELIALGKRYGLCSQATSWVAVETRSDADKSMSQAELRTVPVALTSGWGGHGSIASRRRETLGALRLEQPVRTALDGYAGDMAAPSSPKLALRMGGPREHTVHVLRSLKRRGENARQQSERSGTHDAGDDLLYEILLTQQADGRFPPSEALRRAVSEERWARMQSEVERHGADVAATVLVLVWLTKTHHARRGEWKLAFVKARNWLHSQDAERFPAIRE